jgi:hypothetical protein
MTGEKGMKVKTARMQGEPVKNLSNSWKAVAKVAGEAGKQETMDLTSRSRSA